MTNPLLSRIVRPGVPNLDGCKLFERTSVFIVPQGMTATVEFIWRTGRNPTDLSQIIPPGSAPGTSLSHLNSQGSIQLRVKEHIATGTNESINPTWTLVGYAVDPENGVIQADLPETMVAWSGLYDMSWGILDSAGRLLGQQSSILMVERSQFSTNADALMQIIGPPTIREVRAELMDASAVENPLLQNLEFSDSQIAHAFTKPVYDWNNSLPPVAAATFTTRTFPYRQPWLSAIAGHLHILMANHFRRNTLAYGGGAPQVDDKMKEKEYMAEGTRRLQEYAVWVAYEKRRINEAQVWGAAPSRYFAPRGF